MRIFVSVMQESEDRWKAWVPELPGCAARGTSQQEVSERIERAIRSYLASWDVPVPTDLQQEVVRLEPAMAAGASSFAD
jgi:predicted RNase H-like HicB family nuclease